MHSAWLVFMGVLLTSVIVRSSDFEWNLRADSVDCIPKLADVEHLPRFVPPGDVSYVVTGQMSYPFGVAGPYGYNIKFDGEKFLIQANIHIRNFHKLNYRVQHQIEKNLRRAEEWWTIFNPYKFKIHFDFNRVDDPRYAHVRNLRAISFLKGPYFLIWNPFWSEKGVAHEVGHVMGLVDEYHWFGDKNHCDWDSIMCLSKEGVPQPYHYYLILRRLLCL